MSTKTATKTAAATKLDAQLAAGLITAEEHAAETATGFTGGKDTGFSVKGNQAKAAARTKAAPKATKAPATKAAAPARKKVGSPAAETKKAQTAMKAVALELTPAELVKRLTTTRTAADTANVQVEEFRNMFEAAKVDASNKRVLLARAAYLLCSHKDVATKRYPLFYGGAAKLMATDPEDAKEVGALRKWITTHALAGAALEAKGMVWNQVDPTEAERAIVEKVHDETVRAESAKKNGKVREAAAKGKGAGKATTDENGVEKSKIETAIPTAEGIIAALETIRKNITKFHAEARFDEAEAAKGKEQVQLILADLMGFYPDEDDAADV